MRPDQDNEEEPTISSSSREILNEIDLNNLNIVDMILAGGFSAAGFFVMLTTNSSALQSIGFSLLTTAFPVIEQIYSLLLAMKFGSEIGRRYFLFYYRDPPNHAPRTLMDCAILQDLMPAGFLMSAAMMSMDSISQGGNYTWQASCSIGAIGWATLAGCDLLKACSILHHLHKKYNYTNIPQNELTQCYKNILIHTLRFSGFVALSFGAFTTGCILLAAAVMLFLACNNKNTLVSRFGMFRCSNGYDRVDSPPMLSSSPEQATSHHTVTYQHM